MNVVDHTHGISEDRILHFAGSALFFKLFDEAIHLIQEASFYLEGAGKVDSSNFPFKASQLYNAESVRLTNRLMEVSSWLLAHRSYYRGETQTLREVNLRDEGEADTLGEEVMAYLPVRMCALVYKSRLLHQRIRRLNDQLQRPHVSPVVAAEQGRPRFTVVSSAPETLPSF